MNPLSTLEAYDLLRHCSRLSDRLDRAEVDQLSREGLEPEKRWLSEAVAIVRGQLEGVDALLARSRELPELDVVREDFSEELQDAWVDCLERLHASLIVHAGSRAPILETLFPHTKFPALRRTSAEGLRTYAADLDRRSRLGYVKRILGQEDYAFAEPLVLAIFETLERWEACFRPSEMSEEDAVPLRLELAEAAYRVERFMRQGRLLAEAALAPLDGAFESTGIGRWPRRRIGSVETEAPEPLDGAPFDDGVPLVESLGWGAGSNDAPQEDPRSDESAASKSASSEVTADGAQAEAQDSADGSQQGYVAHRNEAPGTAADAQGHETEAPGTAEPDALPTTPGAPKAPRGRKAKAGSVASAATSPDSCAPVPEAQDLPSGPSEPPAVEAAPEATPTDASAKVGRTKRGGRKGAAHQEAPTGVAAEASIAGVSADAPPVSAETSSPEPELVSPATSSSGPTPSDALAAASSDQAGTDTSGATVTKASTSGDRRPRRSKGPRAPSNDVEG